MKSSDSLRRELWYWKQIRKKNLQWIKKEEDLPPNLQNKEGIEHLYSRLGRIETAIWQLKTFLEEFA